MNNAQIYVMQQDVINSNGIANHSWSYSPKRHDTMALQVGENFFMLEYGCQPSNYSTVNRAVNDALLEVELYVETHGLPDSEVFEVPNAIGIRNGDYTWAAPVRVKRTDIKNVWVVDVPGPDGKFAE